MDLGIIIMLFMLLRNDKRHQEWQKNLEYAVICFTVEGSIIKSWKACVLQVVECEVGSTKPHCTRSWRTPHGNKGEKTRPEKKSTLLIDTEFDWERL